MFRSLSSVCTPFKHRYDSCFNSWFEGYLQPALDASRSSFAFKSLSESNSSAYSVDSCTIPPDKSTHQSRLATSWAGAFRQRSHPPAPEMPPPDTTADVSKAKEDSTLCEGSKLMDTAGKTRAQIKAEEYERACGESWRHYQTCLRVSSRPGRISSHANMCHRKPLQQIRACRRCWSRRETSIRFTVSKAWKELLGIQKLDSNRAIDS